MNADLRERSPRAFYPDFVDQPPPLHGRPAWDQGPERRIDDAAVMRRLGWLGIGLGLAGLVGVAALVSRRLPARNGTDGRLFS